MSGTATINHYFRLVSTGEEVKAPGPDNLYAPGDALFLDKLGKGGSWVKVVRKQSVVINRSTINVHWDVELAPKP